jgi:hypothetical protein
MIAGSAWACLRLLLQWGLGGDEFLCREPEAGSKWNKKTIRFPACRSSQRAGKQSFLEILRDHAQLACAFEKSSTECVRPGSRLR